MLFNAGSVARPSSPNMSLSNHGAPLHHTTLHGTTRRVVGWNHTHIKHVEFIPCVKICVFHGAGTLLCFILGFTAFWYVLCFFQQFIVHSTFPQFSSSSSVLSCPFTPVPCLKPPPLKPVPCLAKPCPLTNVLSH